jgi:hypothetical protein
VAIETTFDCHNLTMTKSDPIMSKTTFNHYDLATIAKNNQVVTKIIFFGDNYIFFKQ